MPKRPNDYTSRGWQVACTTLLVLLVITVAAIVTLVAVGVFHRPSVDTGVPFALATGSDLGHVSFYLKELGLDRWFSEENMVWDDGTYPGKPAPEIYRKAAAKLGLDPSECLVFEDGTSGIRAANAAGAGAVTVICEAKLPSPLTDETRVNGLYHDLRQWRAILAEYGLLR